MKHKTRLEELEREIKPGRRVYQIRFVGSDLEADEIAERENHEPWRPGDGIRFIIADDWLPDWRQEHERLSKQT